MDLAPGGMRLAHLADLHLGYRAYHRLAPGGINARERDVALAFRAALDRIIALEVDLVLVAGDVFHTVRPSNTAIADAFRQFARLRSALPAAPVVVIAGNHDSPRAVETGSILRLLAEIPGVTVVDDVARAIHLEALNATVLCLPHNALASGEAVALEPDPDAATNILMLHGTVAGGGAEEKLRYVSEYGGAKVETSEIRPERWDYVALGHYHIATELAPNMWYAGGIERTSTNIWEEAQGAKGFLTFDTETRKATFHPLPGREVIDLPRFSARTRERARAGAGAGAGESPGGGAVEGRTARGRPGAGAGTFTGTEAAPGPGLEPEEGAKEGQEERQEEAGSEEASEAAAEAEVQRGRVGTPQGPGAPPPSPSPSPSPSPYLDPAAIDARIRALVEGVPGGIDGKIVRLVITDVPRELFRALDHRQIREYKARALHFHLDPRRPEVQRTVGYGAPFRRLTLEQEVEAFLTKHWRTSSPEIEAERLVALARRYLGEAAAGAPEDALVEGGMEP
ncbi:MAG TPA: DNA repair exonuclease [Longimicrobiales bacterium]